MKRKYEKIMLVVLYLLYYVLLHTAFSPVTHDSTSIRKYIYCLVSGLFTWATYILYVKIRNHFFNKKYYRLFDSNQLDECLSYFDKWIERYPNECSLKVNRLIILMLLGKIVDFDAYLIEVQNLNLKDNDKKLAENLSHVIAYFKGQDVSVDKNSEFRHQVILDQVNYLIAFEGELEESEAVRLAAAVYDSQYDLFKSFASLYLWRIYNKKGDTSKEQLYLDRALSDCPSKQIKTCIEYQTA